MGISGYSLPRDPEICPITAPQNAIPVDNCTRGGVWMPITAPGGASSGHNCTLPKGSELPQPRARQNRTVRMLFSMCFRSS